MEGLARRHDLTYTHIDDAKPQHLEVARYVVWGKTYAEIAMIEGLSARHVATICNHPPIVEQIARGRLRAELEALKTLDDFTGMVPKAIAALKSVLDPKMGASNKDKLKAAEMVLDRETSGRFIKTTRHERKEIKVTDSAKVAEIKQIAHNLGRPAAIAVDFELVKETEEIIDWLAVVETIGGY